MGTGASKLGGTITRDSLLKSTEPMRLLMNEGMRVMNEQLTPNDLRRLGSSQECAKYIVLIGDAFDKYFKSINVVPVMSAKERGKRTIYFQRADVLTSTGTAERDQICKTIGYFFTRLYQIISALSASLFDNAAIKPGVAGVEPNIYGILPGVGAAAVAAEQGGPWARLRGGGQLIGGPFELFDAFVERSAAEAKPIYTFKEISTGGATGVMYLADLEVVSKLQGKFTLIYTPSQYSKDTVFMAASMTKSQNMERYTITINEIHIFLQSRGDSYNVSDRSYDFRTLIFNRNERGTYTTPKYVQRDKKFERVNTIFGALGKHIWDNHAALINKQSIPAFWSIMPRGSGPGAAVPGPGAVVPGLPVATAAQAVQPVAHCIARSLQLLSLDIAGPLGGKKAWSFVCEPKFAVSGIPVTTGLQTNMKQLDMLYSIFSRGEMKQMTREYGEYMDVLKKMAAAFEGDGAAGRLTDMAPKAMSGCAGRTGAIEVSGAELASAQLGVQQLWRRQIEHAAAVNKIMMQLFVVDKKTGRLAIHPQLLEIGVVGLDIIAASARKLLIDYYASCEGIYRAAAAAATALPH